MTIKQIHLNAFDMGCPGFQSMGLWRHPADQSHRYKDIEYWTHLAQVLERGFFDSIFVADVLGIYDVYGGGPEAALRNAAQVPLIDPLLPVSAMAVVTEHIGFGITVSATYERPYAFARRMATLDHLTKGRIAWNIVTSFLDSAARNLGQGSQFSHDDRYDLGDEFTEVCYKLWESSWAEDAVVRGGASNIFVDPAKVHRIDHKGRFFEVPGPFLCEPSPQRTPVLYQAGASSRGRAFAGTHAEAVFMVGVRPSVVRRQVADIRARAEAVGRNPCSIKFFSLMTIITAPTDEEAQAKYADYERFVSYEGALTLYASWSGLDLSTYDPDTPLKYTETNAIQTAIEMFSIADPERDWTPRQIAEFLGIGAGGPVVVGSPSTVVDEMQRWVDEADVDGFNLTYAVTPGTFEDVVTYIVPELQRRGLLRTRYEGSTLRENLYGAGQTRLRDDHPGAQFRLA